MNRKNRRTLLRVLFITLATMSFLVWSFSGFARYSSSGAKTIKVNKTDSARAVNKRRHRSKCYKEHSEECSSVLSIHDSILLWLGPWGARGRPSVQCGSEGPVIAVTYTSLGIL